MTHRDRGHSGTTWAIGLLACVLIGGLAAYYGAAATSDDAIDEARDPLAGCTTTTTVRAIAPEVLEPMVTRAATDACIELELTGADGRAGVDASVGTDLWLTDSSLWAAARTIDPGEPVSVASSPIVASATTALAAELGRNGTISWPRLLRTGATVRVGFHDPASTSSGLLGAWPVLKAQRDVTVEPYTALALTAARLSRPAMVGTRSLIDPPDEMLLFSGEYAALPSGSGAVVLRGKQSEPYMDFPAYNLASDPATRAAVDDLIDALASPALADQRAAARLREPDGTANFDTTELGQAPPRLHLPNAGTTIKLYGLSASGSQRGRVLVVTDIGPAMGVVQPDGLPLLESVRSTALVALSALYDHTSVGVWLYGEGAPGDPPYTELAPITPLADGRARLLAAVDEIEVLPSARNTLHETVLAGYQHLQEDFDPESAQSLVVLSAGSPDTSVLTLRQLRARIRGIADPERPIRIIGIGFGVGSDVRGLVSLSKEFGGKSAQIDGPLPLLTHFITVVGQVSAKS